MKKFLTKYIFTSITIVLAIIFIPSKVNTIALENKPSQNSKYTSFKYVIDKYDININVNENNTFNITETITAHFNTAKHEMFFRFIPLTNTITNLDGTTSNNKIKISNLNVDNGRAISRTYGNYNLIKIKSDNKTFTNDQTYIIKYTYNVEKDTKDYDELYYEIIDKECVTAIGNLTFNIIMPKKFDSTKLNFLSDTSINNNIKYNVNGNKISGSYNGIFESGKNLVVKIELPNGYFAITEPSMNFIDYLMLVIPILFLLISIFLWYKFGRDEKIIETVEFYIPENFNSLEVGFLYKGYAENRDVISLLIYLASKGYIKIIDIESKSLFPKSKDFKIIKLKEYDGNNIYEKIFFDGLFTKQGIKDINEITSKDFYKNFYVTIQKILFNINTTKNRNKIFEKSIPGKILIVILMIIATYCLITIPPIIRYGNCELSPSLLFYPFLLKLLFLSFSFFPFLFKLLFSQLLAIRLGFTLIFKILLDNTKTIYINGKAKYSFILSKLISIIIVGISTFIIFKIMALPYLLKNPIYLIRYRIGLGCILGMTACIKYLPRRTPYGDKILRMLKGFKNFLEATEKDKLETMVTQDPDYFYNILPYALVLGVSDKWIKKFEKVVYREISWNDIKSIEFNEEYFDIFINDTIKAISSEPSSNKKSFI